MGRGYAVLAATAPRRAACCARRLAYVLRGRGTRSPGRCGCSCATPAAPARPPWSTGCCRAASWSSTGATPATTLPRSPMNVLAHRLVEARWRGRAEPRHRRLQRRRRRPTRGSSSSSAASAARCGPAAATWCGRRREQPCPPAPTTRRATTRTPTSSPLHAGDGAADRRAPRSRDQSVLELGCATGLMTAASSTAAPRVTGVDRSDALPGRGPRARRLPRRPSSAGRRRRAARLRRLDHVRRDATSSTSCPDPGGCCAAAGPCSRPAAGSELSLPEPATRSTAWWPLEMGLIADLAEISARGRAFAHPRPVEAGELDGEGRARRPGAVGGRA